MEPGRYCIIPSMYMRTNKDTGKTNVGSFWISVYSDKESFRLEGGERIVEEEEGGEDDSPRAGSSFARASTMLGSAVNSPSKSSDASGVMSESMTVMEKRKKFEDAKDEILRQAKMKGIGIRELKMEFAKTSILKRADCRRKMQALGFKVDDLNDEALNVLLNGLEDAGSGNIVTNKLVELFELEIGEDQMACEVPEIEDDDAPEKLHQEGVLQLQLHSATDLVFPQKLRSATSRRLPFPELAFDDQEQVVRRRLAASIFQENLDLADRLRRLSFALDLLPQNDNSFIQGTKGVASFAATSSSSTPVEDFYRLLESRYDAMRHTKSATEANENATSSSLHPQPVFSVRVASATGSGDMSTLPPDHRADALHATKNMQELEKKRGEKLERLQRLKQKALGDTQQMMALPRLIGGRKSGSSYGQCADCGVRVPIAGRTGNDTETAVCAGSSCVNVFCPRCYTSLPKHSKLCGECFRNEQIPPEVLGERLRAVLVEKIGNCASQRARLEELFREFDVDHSGKLSSEEFARALTQLRIQPPLTQDQTRFLLKQFDANNDGEISLSEFSSWILHDRVWDDISGESSTSSVSNDILSSIVIPLRDEIIDAVSDVALMSSSISTWSHTVNSLHQKPTMATVAALSQRGVPLFQRVLTVRGDEERGNVAQQLFERFDADRTGEMDRNEFSAFLTAFGVQTELEDVSIMMTRVQSKPMASYTKPTINLESLEAFVDRLGSRANLHGGDSLSQERYLPTLFTRIYRAVEADIGAKDPLISALRQLRWNMSSNDARFLSHHLRQRFSVLLDQDEVLRLAHAVCFEEDFGSVPDTSALAPDSESSSTRTAVRRSCDVLFELLVSNSHGLATALHHFDLTAISQHLASVVTCNGAEVGMSSIWQQTFGAEVDSPMDQRDFLARLASIGALSFDIRELQMEGGARDRQLVAKLFVSVALDALRMESVGQRSSDGIGGDVTCALMSLLLRYPKIVKMELTWRQGLANVTRFTQGEQRCLVTVATDASRNLIIRAVDPAFKTAADFILRPDDYTYEAIATHLPLLAWQQRDSSAQGTPSESGMLVTSTFHPALNAALCALVARLRVSTLIPSSAGSADSLDAALVPLLTLVESDEFVAAVRGMLAEITLPFFWSVTHEFLDFSIDIDCLLAQSPHTTGTPSFVQRVTDVLSQQRATSAAARGFHSMVLHSSSSLMVRFDVVGTTSRVVMAWEEFQASLAGLQNMYAMIHFRPQDDTFSTSVVAAGAVGAATWNFEKAILLKEPEACSYRIDRPVVYTDTVKVARVEGMGSGNAASSPRVAFVDSDTKAPAHFVIVTVRKTATSASAGGACSEERAHSQLYCTAYDPLTSCDYAVEGYPEDWRLDFFDAATNPDFETQWRSLLRSMWLGMPLTPTLVIKVYSRQPKADQLVGECEVTVASAIARDGHLFHETAVLRHPTRPGVTMGSIQLTFSFDATKAGDAIAAATTSATTRPRRASTVVAPAAPIRVVVEQDKRLEAQQELEEKLKDARCQLQRTEQAWTDANEHVKALKRQLQQAASATSSALDEEAARWKSELERAMRDQALLQEENDKRLAQVQGELRETAYQLAAREAELAKAPPPGPATNLKHAALAGDASAHDILSAMKEILVSRCPERPYNGLKKALAAVTEGPGKVAVAAFEDVLSDYGLAVTAGHRSALYSVLDAEARGLILIEDFFIKLCGDAESYATIAQMRLRTSPPTPQHQEVATPPVVEVAPASPTAPAPSPTRVRKLNWREMKKFLILNLPDGWETRFTEKGRPYFCNHANRSTQWKHPRPEIEAAYSEWMQENGAGFSRATSSSAASHRRA